MRQLLYTLCAIKEHIEVLNLKPIDKVKLQKLVWAASVGISDVPLGVSTSGMSFAHIGPHSTYRDV